MTTETRTAVFESIFEPVYVVLTFDLLDDAGRMRCNYSVRSHTPLPVSALLRAQAVWHSWVSAIVGGALPPLPQGWRVKDGEPEGATSGTPDHFH